MNGNHVSILDPRGPRSTTLYPPFQAYAGDSTLHSLVNSSRGLLQVRLGYGVSVDPRATLQLPMGVTNDSTRTSSLYMWLYAYIYIEGERERSIIIERTFEVCRINIPFHSPPPWLSLFLSLGLCLNVFAHEVATRYSELLPLYAEANTTSISHHECITTVCLQNRFSKYGSTTCSTCYQLLTISFSTTYTRTDSQV